MMKVMCSSSRSVSASACKLRRAVSALLELTFFAFEDDPGDEIADFAEAGDEAVEASPACDAERFLGAILMNQRNVFQG